MVNMRLITRYGIAFFDRYLKDLPGSPLEQKNPSLAEYDFRLK
jgi:hypothetical protein